MMSVAGRRRTEIADAGAEADAMGSHEPSVKSPTESCWTPVTIIPTARYTPGEADISNGSAPISIARCRHRRVEMSKWHTFGSPSSRSPGKCHPARGKETGSDDELLGRRVAAAPRSPSFNHRRRWQRTVPVLSPDRRGNMTAIPRPEVIN